MDPHKVPLLGVNPDLEPLLAGSSMRPAADVSLRIQRVQLSGAALNDSILHPSSESFEMLFRRLPEQGIHSPLVSPQRPFTMEMGSFRVPPEMGLFVFDFRPDVYRFSGADPFDYLPFERRRFSGQMGWDILIDGVQPGNLRFELEPIPRQQQRNAFIPQITNPGEILPQTVFDQAAFNQFGASTGTGLATLPQRPTRYGARTLPMTLYLREGQVFEANAIVFRPIQSPVAFFEFDFAGVLIPKNFAEQILRQMRPVP